MRDNLPLADSPVADALLALKHAVVHTPARSSATNWLSPGSIAAGAQLSYTSDHCQSPTPITTYQSQSQAFSASPTIYDRISPLQTPFQFTTSHHHHHHHHQQQQHRYHSADSQDSNSPSALTCSTSLYNAGGGGALHRPVYCRDIPRDFSFGSAFANDAHGP